MAQPHDLTPTELAAFRSQRVAVEGPVAASAFELRCHDCGGDRFSISEHVVTQPDGEVLQVGVGLTCAACRHDATLFDMRRQGYDGRLGHWRRPRGVQGHRPMKAADGQPLSAMHARASYSCGMPVDELTEIAAEHGIAIQDLYDGFYPWPPRRWRVVGRLGLRVRVGRTKLRRGSKMAFGVHAVVQDADHCDPVGRRAEVDDVAFRAPASISWPNVVASSR